jgi:hypothetical protein
VSFTIEGRTMQTMTSPIQWGNVTLDLDNETFRKALSRGRSMYFDDCEYESPHVASRMNTLDATGSVLDEDGKGGYRFDGMALPGPFDTLGCFLGYMSGPIIVESQEEREAGHIHVVMLPEEAHTVGRAL